MLIAASRAWRRSAYCSHTKSSTRRTFFCCAGTTSAPQSTEFTASTTSASGATRSSFGRLSPTASTVSPWPRCALVLAMHANCARAYVCRGAALHRYVYARRWSTRKSSACTVASLLTSRGSIRYHAVRIARATLSVPRPVAPARTMLFESCACSHAADRRTRPGVAVRLAVV